MRYWVVLIAMFASANAYSQAPGFLGKRFAVFVEANPTPALFVQNINNKTIVTPIESVAEVNRFSFNLRPQVTVEYLLHRDFSLGFSYSKIGVGVTRGYLYEEPTSYYYEFNKDADVLRGQSAGLHLKLYRFDKSESIAPIGMYNTLSLYFTQTNTYDTKQSTQKIFKNDFSYPVVTLSTGRQAMIVKNVLLKTGFEIGWAFVPFNFLTESPSDWNAQEYSGYHVHQSLFGHYMFNINVAVGYIPF